MKQTQRCNQLTQGRQLPKQRQQQQSTEELKKIVGRMTTECLTEAAASMAGSCQNQLRTVCAGWQSTLARAALSQ